MSALARLTWKSGFLRSAETALSVRYPAPPSSTTMNKAAAERTSRLGKNLSSSGKAARNAIMPPGMTMVAICSYLGGTSLSIWYSGRKYHSGRAG